MKKMLSTKMIISLLMILLLVHSNQIISEGKEDIYEYQLELNDLSYSFSQVSMNDSSFTHISVADHGFTTSIGKAQLPMLRYYLQLPIGGLPTVKVIDQRWNTMNLAAQHLPSTIIPVQPAHVKQEPRPDFLYNQSYYTSSTYHPSSWIQLTELGFIRGKRCALLEIAPVKYKPLDGDVQVLDGIDVQITIDNVDYQITNRILSRFQSPRFSQLTDHIFRNHDDFSPSTTNRNPEGYLIISPDEYVPQLSSFVQWKQDQGFAVSVMNTSSIPQANTTTGIKSVIIDAYENWTIPPSFVLLIGDVNVIPTYIGTTGYPGPADAVDLYYSTVNGSDYLPDLFIGRFSISNQTDLSSILNKTLYYQQGQFSDESWVKNASFLAGNDHYQVTEGSHNYVINTFLDPRGFNSDKLYEQSYGATSQDVKNALNGGRGLTVFSGHGNTYYWGDGPSFYQSDVRNLLNINRYPVVFSHSCDTGQFNYGECFAETWIRQNNSGAVAFIGASESTLWTEDDILERAIFTGWWNESIDTLKGILDYGLYEVYQYYGGTGYSKYYFETYNLLGDPSLMVWRDKPSTYNKAPVISNVSVNPIIQEPNGYVNISCMISDESQCEQVILEIQYPNMSIDHIPMYHIGVEPDPQQIVYYFNNTYADYGTYQLQITATDSHGLENTSDLFSFSIGSEYHLTDLIHGWNFVSIPLNLTINKHTLLVSVNESRYEWNESIQQNIVNPTLFSWKRNTQSYDFSELFQAGYGYWMYANMDCTLSTLICQQLNETLIFDNQLHPYWNTIGIINQSILQKQSLTFSWNNSTYTWDEAVNNSLLNNYVFGWNRQINTYEFNDLFHPGFAYWIYAYEPVVLRQTE